MIMMEIRLASSTAVPRCSPKAMRSEEDPKLAKLIPFDMLMKATGNMYPCPFMAAVLSPMLAAVSHWNNSTSFDDCLGIYCADRQTACSKEKYGIDKLQKAKATAPRRGIDIAAYVQLWRIPHG